MNFNQRNPSSTNCLLVLGKAEDFVNVISNFSEIDELCGTVANLKFSAHYNLVIGHSMLVLIDDIEFCLHSRIETGFASKACCSKVFSHASFFNLARKEFIG